jgi:glycine/D-amino acid oxidase-like deaminating enzyme
VTEASVVVLGAGLLGTGTALELARRGLDVALVDQDARALNRASLRNEGKIHLGLVYANDPTLATARLQLDGALSFRRLLARWIGAAADGLARSAPFHYLVANDSLLPPQAIREHYEAVEAAYADRLRDAPEADYLGKRPPRLHRAVELDAR